MSTDLATSQNNQRMAVRDLLARFRPQNDLLALALFGLDVVLFLALFDHTAHHLDVRIPFYRLGEAQQRLDEVLSGGNVVQQWSFAAFAQCIRACKLYDYDQLCWTDFEGNPTAYVHR